MNVLCQIRITIAIAKTFQVDQLCTDLPTFVIIANHHAHWSGTYYPEYKRLYREADADIALSQRSGGR
jgi:hypothetical protein